jgi:hypothetical protein
MDIMRHNYIRKHICLLNVHYVPKLCTTRHNNMPRKWPLHTQTMYNKTQYYAS